MDYDWNLSLIWDYRVAFWGGLVLTLKLTVVSVVAGTVIGYILGVLLSIKSAVLKPLRGVIYLYTAFFGWLPLLVLLVWMLATLVFNLIYRPARHGNKVAYLTVANSVFLGLVLLFLFWFPSEHLAPASPSTFPQAEAKSQ